MTNNAPALVERVYVFIDGSNLYKGMQTHIGPGPFPPQSINRLAEQLCGPRRLVKIMYYNSPLQRDDTAYRAQQQFFDGLRKISYLLISEDGDFVSAVSQMTGFRPTFKQVEQFAKATYTPVGYLFGTKECLQRRKSSPG